ncbi:MAG: hypothetical protein IV100_33300 [Myxococcales bacterium]|nr:hypothetical protein [Myxococcales bacterium]
MSFALVGCPEREPLALQLVSAINPEAGCLFTAGSTRTSRGTIDLVLNTNGYLAGLQLRNALAESETVTGLTAESGQLDSNSIQIVGARMNYMVNGISTNMPSDYFSYSSVIIPPDEEAVAVFDLLPPEALNQLRRDPFFLGDQAVRDPTVKACLEGQEGESPVLEGVPIPGRSVDIIVKVQVESVTIGGNEVLSNEMFFTIRVCMGCLVLPGWDSTSYLLAREGGADFCETTADDRCYFGADNCEEQDLCLQLYNNVDSAIDSRLQACADDPAFPGDQLAQRQHPLCKDMPALSPETEFTRLAHLRCLYGLEKAGAYCDGTRFQLFPNQK